MPSASQHTFHIPVMGTGYTIDTPIRVAQYGISSAISIIDHRLTEQMREYYCGQYGFNYQPIGLEEEDSRARRITAYLDLVNRIVQLNFKKLKNTPYAPGSDLTKYFELLPEQSEIKQEYERMLTLKGENRRQAQEHLIRSITPGSIDVNIMTRVDTQNFSKNNEPLPAIYNDAHAALRGFANSTLQSSVILSAGFNPRLYGYLTHFDDFYPDPTGNVRKKIVLKVSDYRSALIQGKFLAKKGFWVSEFRIESGLNCGGHAFVSDGYLMGPILQEFVEKRKELHETLLDIYQNTKLPEGKLSLPHPPQIAVTAQGGVGTAQEHDFLLERYKLDSVGWGSPFLLVPEAVNIDKRTMDQVSTSGEKDLYLSGVSPLGVPFHTIRNSSAEVEKQKKIQKGKPGAPCLKKHLTFNTEFTTAPICEASRRYQKRKIRELEAEISDPKVRNEKIQQVLEKMCLCEGLGNSALTNMDINSSSGGIGVAICPGPNIAYFDRICSLKDMVSHIYGRINIINHPNRPHMFAKELRLYLDYLKGMVSKKTVSDNQARTMIKNLWNGIKYYRNILPGISLQYLERELMEITGAMNLKLLNQEVEICYASISRIVRITAIPGADNPRHCTFYRYWDSIQRPDKSQ